MGYAGSRLTTTVDLASSERQNHAGCEECRLARMRLAVNIEETEGADASVAQGNGTAKGPETKPLAAGPKTDDDSARRLAAPAPWS